MSTQTQVSKVYADAVRNHALALIGRAGEFTVNQFCHETGLKPTRNLRRRLSELVYNGEIGYTIGYGENNRMTGFFHKPIEKSNEQLEFPMF